MKTLLFYVLQVMICSGMLYGYYHLFLRNKKFHQYNRFYLLAIVILSLLIPAFNIPVYFTSPQDTPLVIYQTLNVFSPGENEAGITQQLNPSSYPSAFNWSKLAWSFYTLVAIVALAKFIIAINKVRLLLRKYPSDKINEIHFINTHEKGTPYSFFKWMFWNNRIELQSEDGQKIFRHELYHIQQKHSWDIILTELLTVVFWINPLFHLIKKEIKAIHEFLADRFAIENSNEWQYAELLLMQALGTQNHRLTNPFFHNQIKRRITMITTSQKPKYQYLRKVMVLPLVAIILTLFAFKYKSIESNPVSHTKIARPITVMIDAGHGGKDNGVMVNNVSEKDIALAIVKKIKALNTNENLKLIFRRLNDAYSTVKEVAAMTDENKADIFISIHVNAETNFKTDHPKKGMEVYISSKKTEDDGSQTLAASIINELQNTYDINRSILKRKTGVMVLDFPKCTCVLIECGYLTNPDDFKFITHERNQEKIAKNILEAITKYAVVRETGVNEESAPLKFGAEKEKDKNILTLKRADTVPSKTYFYIDSKTTKLTGYYKGEKIKSIAFNEKNLDVSMILQNGTAVKLNKQQAENLGMPMPQKQLTTETANKDNVIVLSNPSPRSNRLLDKPLLVIDGVEKGIMYDDLKEVGLNDMLDPNDIESISILKDGEAVRKYGDKAINGVIEIITKKREDKKPVTPKVEPSRTYSEKLELKDNVVFVEVETEPAFPGGDDAFREYIRQNVSYTIDAQNNKATEQVSMRFIVDKEGNVSDIKVINNPGNSLSTEATRLLKNSGKWVPAIQNGHQVAAYRTISLPIKYFASPAISG